METIDKQKAARVWDRVQAQQDRTPDHRGLLALIAGEWADASTYLQLSRRFQGNPSAALRRLYEQEQSHAACLKGIYTLITGEHATVPSPPPPKENTEAVLRRCYGREMQSLAAYEARSSDPEYGQVFARLAAQEREHCHILLTILGSLKKEK